MSSFHNASIRVNANYIFYTEIAIQNYYDALIRSKSLDFDDTAVMLDSERSIMRSLMQTHVFAAMAIESYLNSFISGCIGDDEYYNKYDSLNIIAKLDLVKRFIFSDESSDSESVFTWIRELQKLRNDLVHNKPKDSNLSLNEEDYVPEGEIDLEQLFGDVIVNCRQSIDDNIWQGKKTLKAIAGLAEYIDKHDENAHAKSNLFWPVIFGSKESYRNRAIITVYPIIGVKFKDRTIEWEEGSQQGNPSRQKTDK